MIAEAEYGRFLDLLYQTTVEPHLWSEVLIALADLLGGDSGWLSELDLKSDAGSGLVSRIDPVMQDRYFQYYARLDPFRKASCSLNTWAPATITDEDCITKDELIRTEFYNDFMRPQKSHSVLILRLALYGGIAYGIHINRADSRQQFSRPDFKLIEHLKPHLTRAIRLRSKIHDTLHDGSDALSVLESSVHGIIFLDSKGCIRHANHRAELLMAQGIGLRVIEGRLSAAEPDAARRLQGMVDAAASPDWEKRTGQSMILSSSATRAGYVLTVSPIRFRHLAPSLARRSVLVCISDLQANTGASEEKLRQLYSFTRAEARVALALLDGHTPREAADRLGLSFQTVRNQMKGVFDKTGVNRQSSLVRVLTRATQGTV